MDSAVAECNTLDVNKYTVERKHVQLTIDATGYPIEELKESRVLRDRWNIEEVFLGTQELMLEMTGCMLEVRDPLTRPGDVNGLMSINYDLAIGKLTKIYSEDGHIYADLMLIPNAPDFTYISVVGVADSVPQDSEPDNCIKNLRVIKYIVCM